VPVVPDLVRRTKWVVRAGMVRPIRSRERQRTSQVVAAVAVGRRRHPADLEVSAAVDVVVERAACQALRVLPTPVVVVEAEPTPSDRR